METREVRITDEMMATNGQRFLNYIIDIVILYFIIFCFGTMVLLLSMLTGNSSLLEWMGTIGNLEGYLIFILTMILYYTVIESYFSRSVGKYITRTIVVNEDGSKPDSQTILKRTLCRFIPFDNFSFLGSPTRGWHDSISDTYVVNKRLLDEKRNLLSSFDEIGKESSDY